MNLDRGWGKRVDMLKELYLCFLGNVEGFFFFWFYDLVFIYLLLLIVLYYNYLFLGYFCSLRGFMLCFFIFFYSV